MLVSPPFNDKSSFRRCKQFFIRSWIHAEYIDSAMIVSVSINEKEHVGKTNVEKLKKLGLLDGEH